MNYREKTIRRLVENFEELDDKARADVIDRIQYNGVIKAAMDAARTETVTFGDLFDKAAEMQDTFNMFAGIGCGLKYFDDATMGFRPGEVTVIAAPSNVGKTLVSLNIVTNTVINSLKRGLIISMEMTKEEIASRVYNVADPVGYDYLKENLVIQTDLKVNTDNIKYIIEREKPDIVMIDMLQKLADRERGSEYERVSAAMAKTKALALNQKVPIILISHVAKTRSGANGEASAMDLKGASNIEQDADIVIMMNKPNRDSKDIIFNLVKHRTRYPAVFHKRCAVGLDGIKIANGGDYAIQNMYT